MPIVEHTYVSYRPELPVKSFVKIAIKDLHPTQAVVGKLEVKDRIKRMSKMGHKEFDEYLQERIAPIVIGPEKKAFIVDHHHLSYALEESGLSSFVYGEIKADWSDLAPKDFWDKMQKHHWTYLKDEEGKNISFKDLPNKLAQLKNDPYRSLAWAVKGKGVYVQTIPPTPFLEFLWANFFRDQIKRKTIEEDIDKAVIKALEITVPDVHLVKAKS
jgi:hypothetical protein